MEMKTYKKGSFFFVEFPEDLLEDYDEELEQVLKNTIALNKYHIVVDLKNISYLSSFTLRILIKYHKAARDAGRSFSLLHLDDELRKFLAAARLDTVFPIFPNEEELFRHADDKSCAPGSADQNEFCFAFRMSGGAVIADLSGMLENVDDLRDFEAAVIEHVKARRFRFVFNLARLSFIDSLCIGRFVKLNRFLLSREGKLAFCGMSDIVKDFFNVLGLNSLLILCDTENDALQKVS